MSPTSSRFENRARVSAKLKERTMGNMNKRFSRAFEIRSNKFPSAWAPFQRQFRWSIFKFPLQFLRSSRHRRASRVQRALIIIKITESALNSFGIRAIFFVNRMKLAGASFCSVALHSAFNIANRFALVDFDVMFR